VTLHRFFLTGPLPEAGVEGAELPLSEGDRHHIARVLRLVTGDRIVVSDASGREAIALLVEVSASGVTGTLSEVVERPRRPRVVLAPAVSRKERMELTIQKATELGVAEVWPLLTARCVVKLDDDRAGRKTERWHKIAEEAAKQSQRETVPVVREPQTISELAAETGNFGIVLVPWEEGTNALGIGQALDAAGATPDTAVLVVIGPEGGLEESEVAALEAAGGVVVSLGDTILRTETAAIVASALALYELGALGGRGR
jgi:16S rRNA (uracil1498-N3)-methyltransferase